MGLDLAITPLRNPRDLMETQVSVRTWLEFDRDYNIFGQMSNCSDSVTQIIHPKPLPVQLWLIRFGTIDSEIEAETRTNKNDEDLMFVYAKEFKKLHIDEDSSPFNLAIKAYINLLPDSVPIILWWK